MLNDILKVGACEELIKIINEKGYTVREISKNANLEYKEVKKFMEGETDELDFLMLVNLCNFMNLNVFDFVKDDIKLKEFLNLVY